MTEDRAIDRAHLVELRQHAEASYDRTVLSLSGGALGLSLAFMERLMGPAPFTAPVPLRIAWVAWGASLLVVLASHYLSSVALTKAIGQLDDGAQDLSSLGEPWNTITRCLNLAGGLLFLGGLAAFMTFIFCSTGAVND
jgi:hypothetical protein